MRSFREHPMPFPEVRMGPWTIRLSDGYGNARTSLEKRQMFVPDGDTPEDQWFRDHEVAHAIFTPKMGMEELSTRHGISPEALDAAENMRLNFMLNKKGLNAEAKPMTNTDVGQSIEHNINELMQAADRLKDPAYKMEAQNAAFLSAVSSVYTQDVGFGVSLIEKYVEDREVVDFLFQTIRSAHFILDRGRLRAQRRGSPEISFRCTIEVAKLLQSALVTMGRMGGSKYPDYVENGSTLWGEMKTEIPPMETPSKWRHRFSKIRRSDSGVRMTAIPRLLTDQKIFSYKIRKKGGTVLIDCSGSMSLSPDEIYNIVCAAPAATVALYSGDGAKGVLRIVAEDGKLASPKFIESPGGGGNTIDGPALRWLAKRTMPRVWVSDGQVTGVGDAPDGMLYSEAQMIKRINQIVQVSSGAAALEVFTKGGI